MKISIVADCHLNKVNFSAYKDKDSGRPYKAHDFMKAFEWIINKNINDVKPDLLVIAGDVYDTYDPSNDVRAFFSRQVAKLVESKIPVIILVGNHDICKKNHALSPLAEIRMKNVKVIEEPKFIKFRDHILLMYPYSISVERSIISNRKLFYQFAEENKKKIEENEDLKDLPVLFFGHFGVKGAALNLGTSAQGKTLNFVNTSSHDISVSDLDKSGADYVFLGDYHSHQILGTKNCIAMYTGSIEKDDITHRDLKKGFVVYDDTLPKDPKYGKSQFVEYSGCRPMIAISGSLKDIRKGIETLDKKDQGASVRVIFKGNTKEAHDYHLALETLRQEIRTKIQPVHLLTEQKVVDKEAEQKGKEVEQKIIETGHMTEDEVMEVIGEILKEQVEEDEYKILYEMAKEIRKEAKEIAR
jgi:exonuclease SbcD